MRSLFAFVILALGMTLPALANAPRRIVSVNLCTDILLFELADRSQIASLSFLAEDPTLSVIAGKTSGIPINYGSAEEVRLLEPDLVLAGDFGARFAVSILRQHHYRVVQVPAVLRLNDIAPTIEKIGAAVGHEDRGQALAGKVRQQLASLANERPLARPSAIIFQPRGLAAGRPSLADDVLTLAGARNRVTEAAYGDWIPLGVEGLLDLNPDIVVLDTSGSAPPALSEGVFAHRALKVFAAKKRMIRVASKLWSCGTPDTLSAVTMLRNAFGAEGAAHD